MSTASGRMASDGLLIGRIRPDGLCISYGNPAEDAANKTVLAAHRENVEVLLPRAGEIWDLP